MEKLSKLLVLDGAMGTEIIKILGNSKDLMWGARCIQKEEHVFIPIHRNYLASGADVISTNTYETNTDLLMKYLNISFEDSMELLRKAAKIACQVRDEFWEKAQKEGTKRCRPLVVGSQVSHAGRSCTGDEGVGVFAEHTSLEEMIRGHRDKTRALLEGGVDLLAFETFPYAGEGKAIAELMKEFPEAKAWLSFCCKDGKHTRHGELFKDAVMTSLLSEQIVAVGVNCTNPEFVTSLLQEIPDEVKEKKMIVVYPNSGQEWDTANQCWLGEATKPLHGYISEWIANGANWIGGCCNITPDDISKVKQVMDTYR